MATATADRAIEAAASLRARVRDLIDQQIEWSWYALGSWRDRDIEQWIAATVPLVIAGQRQIANATEQAFTLSIGGTTTGIVDVTSLRGGVDPAEVYWRPAVEMRTALAKGAALTVATKAGATRARSIAATDLQLAHTHQARRSMEARDVQFYQRVPKGAVTCALCLIASTQHYRVKNLLPIHPGCDCGVKPLPANAPRYQAEDGSWRVIDRQALEATHEQIDVALGRMDRAGRRLGNKVGKWSSKGYADYSDVLVVHEHGEIGPVLGFRGDHFTGPSDIAH